MSQLISLIVPSDAKYLSLIRGTLKSFLKCHKVSDIEAGKIVLCVDEACSNVIKYSYEGCKEKPIEIAFDYDGETFVSKIRDYGKQCDVQKIKPRCLDDIRPGGLGTHFIFQIMDNVEFCTKREKGTLLTMTKRLEPCMDSVSSNLE